MTQKVYQHRRNAMHIMLKAMADDKGTWKRLSEAEKDAWAGVGADVLIEGVIAPEPWLKLWGYMTKRVHRAETAVIEMTRLLDEQALQLGNFGLCAYWVRVRQKIQSGEHTQAFCW